MKHIISLSMKYIRRQKTRTLLTFLCITLSVFILCTFGAYIGSTLQTAKNKCIRQYGSYEAELDNWLEQIDSDKLTTAIDIIQNHIDISDYDVTYYAQIASYKGSQFGVRSGENNNIMTYAEIDDSKNIKRIGLIDEQAIIGNPELKPGYNQGIINSMKDGGAVVPEFFKEMGYSVGDTLSFTIRPVIAEIDEDSPIMKEVRQKLLDETGYSVMSDDLEFEELDRTAQKETLQKNIGNTFEYYGMSFDDVPMKNAEYGEPVEISLKIGGFDSYFNSAYGYGFSVKTPEIYSIIDRIAEKNPDMITDISANANIRINENVDFDDAMQNLYGALGFPKDNYYADLPKLNDDLLFLESRSASAITTGLPAIILIFLLIFLAWLVARFVIDNAFEISNQERSSQYALLRVIGASKRQIATLVCTEAFFYTITAVPIGTITAYLFCSSFFKSLRNLGFEDFEFKANIYFIIGGIILCILAIFISAYTSAMWASRKLSPAEALNFGKPKKSKKIHKRKSKIKLNSKQFLRRYTSKNIARNKGRYIISTVTMALGTMFFTFSMMLGLFLYSDFSKYLEREGVYDFNISYISPDMLDEAKEKFSNEKIFDNYEITTQSNYMQSINDISDLEEKLNEILPYKRELRDSFIIMGISRDEFDKYIAQTSGMTYDEFLQSGKGIYSIPCYSYSEVVDENSDITEQQEVRQYDDYYKSFDKPATVKFNYKNISIDIIGGSCSEFQKIPCIIVPLDSEIAGKIGITLIIKAKVNGQENYAEAEKIYSEFVEKSASISYSDDYSVGTGLSEFTKAIIKIAVTFISAIWLVGILSMVNSINTSVLNRSRELMMLRSVGMSRKQLRKMVLLESVMFSALASSSGILLAMGVFFIVMNIMGFQATFLVSMAIGLILSIAVNILIAILASIPGARSLEKAESLMKTF